MIPVTIRKGRTKRLPTLSDVLEIRTGTIALSILELTKAVTFSTPMSTSSYNVHFGFRANLTPVLWTSSETANGFTLNLSSGIDSTITYTAVAR